MPTDQYRERPDELDPEARTFARLASRRSRKRRRRSAGTSSAWRLFETDDQARAIVERAQKEEFLHFAIDLEFLARRKEKWRIALQKILFTDGDIVEVAEQAEDAVED